MQFFEDKKTFADFRSLWRATAAPRSVSCAVMRSRSLELRRAWAPEATSGGAHRCRMLFLCRAWIPRLS